MRNQLHHVVLPLFMLAGCAPMTTDTEGVAENRAPIYIGTDNTPGRVSTNDLRGPSAAVGQLNRFVNKQFLTCSATAISRTTIITARHCFCEFLEVGTSFSLPQQFVDSSGTLQNGFRTFVVGPVISHSAAFDICVKTSPNEQPEVSIADIELLRLETPIPIEALPELPAIDLSENVLSTIDAYDHFALIQVGFGGTAWNDGANKGTRREGIIERETLEWGYDYKFPNLLEGYFLEADADCTTCSDEHSTSAPGDSGGGFFLQPLDANNVPSDRPILIGVISGATDFGAFQFQQWTSTGSRNIFGGPNVLATSNAALILQALGPDADNDGILDGADNCAPPSCTKNCANPNQQDTDNDGLGDFCDTCPAIPDDGRDRDADGRADVCDPCPYCAHCDVTDFDGDGIGAGCDTCPGIPNPSNACTVDADCPLNYCVRTTGPQLNRCALQRDDVRDHDGLGDSCDPCPDNHWDGDLGLFSNSNWQVEAEFNAPQVTDVCDDVPQFIARPIIRPFGDPDFSSVEFLATSTFGSPFGNAVSFLADVGFRHCDCYDSSGALLDRALCIATQCSVDPSTYTDLSRYKKVTMQSSGGSAIFPVAAQDPTFTNRPFSNQPHNGVDTFPHPFDDLPGWDDVATARVGTIETVRWLWQADIAAGHIDGHPAAMPLVLQKTAGIFETVVRSPVDNFASTRDGNILWPQQLRRVHAYVKTPLVAGPPDFSQGASVLDPCGFLPCSIILQPEFARINPDPTQDPFLEMGTPIHLFVEGGIIYWAGTGAAFGDGSTLLAPDLQSLLLAGDTQWLRPIERGVTARQLGTTTQLVALPNTWTTAGSIAEIGYDDGEFYLVNAGTTPLGSAVAAPPAARTGARGLLSLARRSVYLVGGRTSFDRPTGEVWRYDLDTQQWHEDTFYGPRIKDVLALTYDSATDRLIILHRIHPPRLPSHVYRVQLLSLDYRTHRTTLVDEWPVANTFERISVTARQDGSFIFLGSEKNGQHVKAYRFRVDGATMHWLGTTTVPGRLLDEPAVTNAGIVAPIRQAGSHVMKTITSDQFVPPNKGWVTL